MYFKFLMGVILFSNYSLVNPFALPHEGLWRLDVVHYNDFHARFEETSLSSSICRTNDDNCLGGFARLYAEIMSLLEEKPNAILLDAGDSFQGTYWYTLLKWNITQKFMNLLPHDAHAIGNHEFDDGPAGLAPYLSHLKAPCLAANMDTSKEPLLQNLYKNHTIVERNGRKIGIIGVTTVETKLFSSPGKTVFGDERVAAQREAKLLADQGVDIIVLLSHAGIHVDRDIATNYGENIDLIVGGHTHSLMWNGPAPSGETVVDTYPVIIQSTGDTDHKVVIVQTSSFTKYMGNLSVYFDFRGDFYSWEGGPIFLNRSYVEDKNIKEMLAPYAVKVREAENTVIGKTVVKLELDSCKYGECLIGNMYCDALLEYAKKNISSTLPDVAVTTRNNIYGSIDAGNITAGSLFETFPYRDRIRTFKLKGRHLIEALEHSLAEAWSYKPFQGPRVLQFSGMQVIANVSLPAYQRVLSVEVFSVSSYHPLDPEQYVRVTGPAFVVDGGQMSGGFMMFARQRIDTVLLAYETDILYDYLARHSPLTPHIDGRLQIIE